MWLEEADTVEEFERNCKIVVESLKKVRKKYGEKGLQSLLEHMQNHAMENEGFEYYETDDNHVRWCVAATMVHNSLQEDETLSYHDDLVYDKVNDVWSWVDDCPQVETAPQTQVGCNCQCNVEAMTPDMAIDIIIVGMESFTGCTLSREKLHAALALDGAVPTFEEINFMFEGGNDNVIPDSIIKKFPALFECFNEQLES